MQHSQLILKVLTPEATVFEGDVEAVYVPGGAGRFEILPGHAPIVSSLSAGVLKWVSGGTESSLQVRSGALMLNNNLLTVCAEPSE
ncbi:MAG: F0F1 ATP synthase subunit epsilon [Bacteroidales bacterium]|nr:F0F1 ATP synthase subunit epsilon [Bacteroidales bacterium]